MYAALLERLKAGEELEKLLPEFSKAARTSERGTTPAEILQADAERDFSMGDSFADVELAMMEGSITKDQYAAIRRAVAGA